MAETECESCPKVSLETNSTLIFPFFLLSCEIYTVNKIELSFFDFLTAIVGLIVSITFVKMTLMLPLSL